MHALTGPITERSATTDSTIPFLIFVGVIALVLLLDWMRRRA